MSTYGLSTAAQPSQGSVQQLLAITSLLDRTPLSNNRYVGAGKSAPSHNEKFGRLPPTGFTVIAADEFALPVGMVGGETPTALIATSPLQDAPLLAEAASASLQELSEVEQIAGQRIALMAAKYAQGAQSIELLARLQILNHKLLQKSPRVTAEQVATLESVSKLLESTSSQISKVRESLGLTHN